MKLFTASALFVCIVISSPALAGDSEIIVESFSSGFNFEWFKQADGKWAPSTGKSKAAGTAAEKSMFIDIKPGGAGGAARFQPDIPADGKYEVFYTFPTSANCAGAIYNIHSVDGDKSITADQNGQADQGAPVKPNDWISLGVFQFKKGTDGYVEIKDPGTGKEANQKEPNRRIYADAVKFVPQGFALPASFANKSGGGVPAPVVASAASSPSTPFPSASTASQPSAPPALPGVPPALPLAGSSSASASDSGAIPTLPGIGAAPAPNAPPSLSGIGSVSSFPGSSAPAGRSDLPSIGSALSGAAASVPPASSGSTASSFPSIGSGASPAPPALGSGSPLPSLGGATSAAPPPLGAPTASAPAAFGGATSAQLPPPPAIGNIASAAPPAFGGSGAPGASAPASAGSAPALPAAPAGMPPMPGALAPAAAGGPAAGSPGGASSGSSGSDSTIQWMYDLGSAQSAAKSAKKNIMIFFVAQGNRDVARYEKDYFTNAQVRAALEKFVLMRVDFPSNTHVGYNLGIFRSGTIAVTDLEGAKLATIVEMPSSAEKFAEKLASVKPPQ